MVATPAEAASYSGSSEGRGTLDGDSVEGRSVDAQGGESAKVSKELNQQRQMHQLFKESEKEYSRANLARARIVSRGPALPGSPGERAKTDRVG